MLHRFDRALDPTTSCRKHRHCPFSHRPPGKNGRMSTPSANGAAEIGAEAGFVPDRELLPPLTPRGALGVVDEATKLIRLAPGMFFGVACLIVLPLRLGVELLPGSTLRGQRPDDFADAILQDPTEAAQVASLLATSLGLFCVAVVVARIASLWYIGVPSSTQTGLAYLGKRLHATLGCWLVVVIGGGILSAITVGFGALILPMLLFSPALVGAEGLGGLKASNRSFNLGAARFGATFATMLVIALATFLIGFLATLLPAALTQSILGFQLLNLPTWLVAGVMDIVGSVLSAVFFAAAVFIAYLDNRVVNEGIDLTLLLDARSEPTGTDR